MTTYNSGIATVLFNGSKGIRRVITNNFNADNLQAKLQKTFQNTTGDTGAKIATFAGATQINNNGSGAFISIILGVVTGVTPTLSCQLQYSPDGGTTWINFAPAIANLTTTNQTGTIIIYPATQNSGGGAGTALTTGSNATLLISTALPKTWRINYIIGGTTPSFSITNVYVNYMA